MPKGRYILLLISIGVIVFMAAAHYGFLRTDGLFSSVLSGDATAAAREAGTAKVVFVVHCYDEGNDALKGLKGIRKIERGFRHFREINTVYYNPGMIAVQEMEKALKLAGTYTETIRE
jgi:hypothetical protein